MPRKPTRRDFLKGRAAADALADAVQAALPSEPSQGTPADRPAGTYLLQMTRQAMAGQFELYFNAGQYPDATTAGLEALDLVSALEDQLSFFREESEISRLNRFAAREPVEVEPRLFALLKLALDLSVESEGAFDITSTPLWEAWGFARRAGRVPAKEQLAAAMDRVGYHLVELDSRRRTVRFKKPGVRLNLGSIGKGYSLDRAAEVLASAGLADFLFHGGQSSILARGTRWETAAAPPGASRGWTVGVRHPLCPDQRWAEIRLQDRTLGTSGGTFQSFRHEGKRYVHILDPRTGWPVQGVLSVTVVAPSATLADALSTLFFVLGPERALDLCRRKPDIALLMTTPDKSGAGFQLHTVGFGEDDLRFVD